MDFQGDFESHLTLNLPPADLPRLRQYAEQHNLKFTHIVLDRGEFSSQPMLTRTAAHTTLNAEIDAATNLTADLAQQNLHVSRIKIEAAPWNAGIPRSTAEALAQPPERYFENHVKLLLQPSFDLQPLRTIAVGHNTHLSRNTLRTRSDGRQERFATQRCRQVPQHRARECLNALLDDLKQSGYTILEVEEEFVVYDTNLDLDAGWIQHLNGATQ